jgi:hypothetical protein
MQRQPPHFDAITCQHCGAIVALIPPGALIYDTRMRCVRCAVVVVIVKPLDNKISKDYTEHMASA